MLFVSGDKDTVFLTKSKAFYYFLLQKLSNLLKFRMYGSYRSYHSLRSLEVIANSLLGCIFCYKAFVRQDIVGSLSHLSTNKCKNNIFNIVNVCQVRKKTYFCSKTTFSIGETLPLCDISRSARQEKIN